MKATAEYKQTEVGQIPADWDVKRLDQISPSQSVGLVINPSSYFSESGTVAMLLGSNIEPNRINHESARRISNASNKLIPASRLSAGDLVSVRVGDPGITAVVPTHLDGCNCASMMIVRKGEGFDSRWLCYLMNSPIGLRQVRDVQYGTAQKQFNISDAVGFLFPYPRRAEQEAIAEALSDADALIESLERLLAKKHQIKQGAMQELLTGKRRLPGFGGNQRLKKTEIGSVPQDWDVKPVSSVAFVTSGKRLPAGHSLTDQETPHPYIRVTDMRQGKIVLDDIKYVPVDAFPFITRYRIFTTDIFISVAGTLGVVGKIPRELDGANLTENADRITDIACSQDFLLHVLQSPIVQTAIEQLQTVGAQPKLALERIRKFLIPLPPSRVEQDLIAECLSDMDADLTALESKVAKARQVKQGMMQELLSGRIRLI